MRKHIIPLRSMKISTYFVCIINKSTRNHNRNIRRIRGECVYDMHTFVECYFLYPNLTSSKRKPSCHLSFGVYASHKIKYMLHYTDTCCSTFSGWCVWGRTMKTENRLQCYKAFDHGKSFQREMSSFFLHIFVQYDDEYLTWRIGFRGWISRR